MNRTTRFVALLLAVIMVCSALASCNTTPAGTATNDATATGTAGATATGTAGTTATGTTDDDLAKIETMKNFITDYSYVGASYPLESTYDAPTIYPPANQHPRVMFTAEDIPTILANMSDPTKADAYAGYRAERDDSSTVDAILRGDNITYFDDSMIEAKAFAYAVEGDVVKGYEAILILKNGILKLPKMDLDTFDEYGDDYTRTYGAHITTIAKVYDWCYPLLTAEEKEMMLAAVYNLLAPYMEIGMPPNNPSPITSHQSENQLLQDWLALSIAVYDEYPDVYEFVGGRFFEEYVTFRNYYYASDFIHQGSSYGTYRFLSDIFSDWIMQVINDGKSVYVDNIANVIHTFSYFVRPDNRLVRQGDDGRQNRFYNLATIGLITAGLYGDGIAKYMSDYYGSRDGYGSITDVEILIINDPTVESVPISTQSLVTYNGSPLGMMIARTGWDQDDINSDDIIVLMKVGERNAANHEHDDAGTFQIYYKGALAIDSAGNEGNSGGKNSAYTEQTIAHNGLLIKRDSDYEGANSGGQKSHDEPLSLSEFKNAARLSGKTLAHESLEADGVLKYAYIAGDITKAYYPNAVGNVDRYMLFVPTEDDDAKGLFFVFDNIRAKKANFEKVYLLHMMEEPTLEGNKVIIKRETGDYNGQLANQTLLPLNPTYTVIGGDGQQAMVNGVNYADGPVDYNSATDDGWGRVEISTSGNTTDYFLNVMTIGDAGAAIPEATLIETETHAAAKILNYVAVFTKNESKETSEEFSFAVGGDEAELTYLVTGMAAGNWKITVDGQVAAESVTATEDGGMLYFTAPAGNVTVTPVA